MERQDLVWRVTMLLLLHLLCIGHGFRVFMNGEHSEINTLKDPLDQSMEFESKTVVAKSVFAVPLNNASMYGAGQNCPDGQRRLQAKGPCVKIVSGPAVVDDKLVTYLVKEYFRNRTSKHTSTRQMTTEKSTTPLTFSSTISITLVNSSEPLEHDTTTTEYTSEDETTTTDYVPHDQAKSSPDLLDTEDSSTTGYTDSFYRFFHKFFNDEEAE